MRLLIAAVAWLFAVGISVPVLAQGVGENGGAGPSRSLVSVTESEPAMRGSYQPGAAVTRSVTVRNVSPDGVFLRPVRVSCPCVNVQMSQQFLASAEECTVVLSTTAGEVSSTQWYVAEFEALPPGSAGRGGQAFSVRIGYAPDTEYVVIPDRILIAGRVGVPTTALLSVRSLKGPRPQVSDMRLNGVNAKVKSIRPSPLGDRVTEVIVEVVPERCGTSVLNAECQVGGAEGPTLHAFVVVKGLPAIDATPAGVVFDDEQTRSSRIHLRERNESDRVESVECDREWVRVRVERDGEHAFLHVELAPEQAPVNRLSDVAYARVFGRGGRELGAIPIVRLRLSNRARD
jgi:hypothetical protein